MSETGEQSQGSDNPETPTSPRLGLVLRDRLANAGAPAVRGAGAKVHVGRLPNAGSDVTGFDQNVDGQAADRRTDCLLYTSPSPRDS